jgi:3D (Asp-Asp-Asp) domain-containing protein
MGGGRANTALRTVREGVQYLSDLVAGFVSRIKAMAPVAPLAFALGCEASHAETKHQLPQVASIEVGPITETPVVANDEAPRVLGTFDMTFYYVAGEEDVAKRAAKKAKAAKAKAKPANDNGTETELAAVAPVETVTLYQGKTCAPIADVSKEFAAQLSLQGTGKLKDGRILNVWGACSCDHSPCFKVTETKWGTGGTGRPLQPYRTVAVDPKVVKLGSLLYVPALEGVTMPGREPWGGYVHDGCVVADDTGGGIKGKQLDLFVGRKSSVDLLSRKGGSHKWARNVPVYYGSDRCERKGRKVGRKSASI